jgi:tetratricopeptide (TPR) repeat protein
VAQQAPRDGEAHFRLGQLLLKQGKLEPARLHAKMAVDLAPDTIEHRLCLARVLLALDAKKLARKELDAVLAISPANAEASALVKKVRWSVRGGD